MTCWCTRFPTRTTCCASMPAIRIRTSSTSATHNRAGAQIENAGARYSQLAIQGPKALGILQRFTARAPIAHSRITTLRLAKWMESIA